MQGIPADQVFLIILWEKALPAKKRIMEDIASHFNILASYEIRWSPALFSSNLTRFYGTYLPDGSHKEMHCGSGPFFLAVVRDPTPMWEMRKISKGLCRVNVRALDLKKKYREWTGGGHRVHATLMESETRHDMRLLLHRRVEDFLCENGDRVGGSTERLEKDLVGASGWRDLREFFDTLNDTARYAVLRNFERIPEHLPGHEDIDLLTDDYANLVYLANGEKVFRKRYRVHYSVAVAGERKLFDFRYTGDGYYDEKWQRDMLERREKKLNRFYALDPEDYFYSLLYHALVHKREIGEDYRSRLSAMAAEIGCEDGVGPWSSERMRSLLELFMKKKGYSYTDPDDLSVYFNSTMVRQKTSLVRAWNDALFQTKQRLRPLKHAVLGNKNK